ncbi:hypothetical protein K2X89_14940 [Myxococcota bacterium]|nr:hypothetical protein [Myxococcota bacterium]
MKEAVTDWQRRLAGGERVPNDHADPAWDPDVLARFDSLVDDAKTWLSPLASRLARLVR